MKKLLYILLTFTGCCLTRPSFAEQVYEGSGPHTIVWDAVTTNEYGDPLDSDELANLHYICGVKSGEDITVMDTVDLTSYELFINKGSYYFGIRTTITIPNEITIFSPWCWSSEISCVQGDTFRFFYRPAPGCIGGMHRVLAPEP